MRTPTLCSITAIYQHDLVEATLMISVRDQNLCAMAESENFDNNFINAATAKSVQACPWEWDSHGNPMGNVPWDGMGWDSTNCNSHGIENLLNEHSDSEYEYQ
ncbi:unnamed protein product [Clavelina lepadiformis]|uniref:Uncharacterized protein n=1 Tax=Clavelina lepadiformis TaxID=159417 RepID=A0ABP0G0D2_CLALP